MRGCSLHSAMPTPGQSTETEPRRLTLGGRCRPEWLTSGPRLLERPSFCSQQPLLLRERPRLKASDLWGVSHFRSALGTGSGRNACTPCTTPPPQETPPTARAPKLKGPHPRAGRRKQPSLFGAHHTGGSNPHSLQGEARLGGAHTGPPCRCHPVPVASDP